MAKLTEKQCRFIDYYIQTGNQVEAARKAGYKKPEIQGAQNYAKLRPQIDERLKAFEDSRIADATEVLQALTRVLRREEPEHVVVTIKKHKSWYDDDGKKVIEDTEEPTVVEVPASVANVNRAADLLGKRYGLYTDKVDMNGSVTMVFSDDYGDEADG